MTRIVLSSVIANKYCNGGNAWVILSWLRGLQRLGFDVYFVEAIGRANCVDSAGCVTSFENSVNLAYFKRILSEWGFKRSAALIYEHGEEIYGASAEELLDLAAESALLINVSGHLAFKQLRRVFRKQAYLDLDPGFTQFWHALNNPGPRLTGHDFYFTVGENIGTPACNVPTGDIPWRSIRQPVVLEDWPVYARPSCDPFTTVASWRGPYGAVTYEGKTYGLKVHEFRKFLELPERTGQTFELALDIHPVEQTDLTALEAHSWKLVEAKTVVPDPSSFRHFVQNSGAEFSVAQGIYVDTGCGWFSDRTTRYLASGRPALVQDTGFSRYLPAGEGLVPFRTLQEAVAGAQSIARDYGSHCRAARALCEEYFDSDKILSEFVDRIGVST